jgi:hypothetical protein
MNRKNIVIAFLIFGILAFAGCTKNAEVSQNPTMPAATSSQTPIPIQTVIVSEEPPEPSPTQAEPITTEEEILLETEGVFSYIEWGDYLHLYMIDSEGSGHSFFVLKYPGLDVESLTEGEKIKVYWRNVDVFLDAPQEIITLNELVRIDILD